MNIWREQDQTFFFINMKRKTKDNRFEVSQDFTNHNQENMCPYISNKSEKNLHKMMSISSKITKDNEYRFKNESWSNSRTSLELTILPNHIFLSNCTQETTPMKVPKQNHQEPTSTNCDQVLRVYSQNKSAKLPLQCEEAHTLLQKSFESPYLSQMPPWTTRFQQQIKATRKTNPRFWSTIDRVVLTLIAYLQFHSHD